MKKIVLEEISSVVIKLKAHIVLKIPKKTISEVADAVEITESLGVKVG